MQLRNIWHRVKHWSLFGDRIRIWGPSQLFFAAGCPSTAMTSLTRAASLILNGVLVVPTESPQRQFILEMSKTGLSCLFYISTGRSQSFSELQFSWPPRGIISLL